MKKEDEEKLLDHNYDGIQEFDFNLPTWWLATFWGGIVFAVIYISYYIFMNGPSLQDEYYADEAKMKKVRMAYIQKLKNFDEEKFNKYKSDDSMKLYGQTVFQDNCMACHNTNAAGDIGPNLTDSSWLFTEGTSKELFQFIIKGNPSGGMPTWGGVLSKEDIYAVSTYITSLKGFKHTNPPAKEALGDEYP